MENDDDLEGLSGIATGNHINGWCSCIYRSANTRRKTFVQRNEEIIMCDTEKKPVIPFVREFIPVTTIEDIERHLKDDTPLYFIDKNGAIQKLTIGYSHMSIKHAREVMEKGLFIAKSCIKAGSISPFGLGNLAAQQQRTLGAYPCPNSWWPW